MVQIGHLWIDHYEACRTASECLIRPGSPVLALIQYDVNLYGQISLIDSTITASVYVYAESKLQKLEVWDCPKVKPRATHDSNRLYA